jgi:hypothetical protein
MRAGPTAGALRIDKEMPYTKTLASVIFVCCAISALARAQGDSDDPPERPRVYVYYDCIGYSSRQDACSTDNQSTALVSGHAGEQIHWRTVGGFAGDAPPVAGRVK